MGDNAVTCFFVSKEKVSDIAYLKSRCKNYESIGEECNTGGFPFNDSYFIYQKFSLTIDFDRSLTEYSSSKFFDEEEKADIRFRKLKIKRKEECN